MDKQEFLAEFPKLVKKYQPAADVIKKISNLHLLVVIGPTGVGKTTLINSVGLPYVPSDVTRLPRKGERDGVDYHFRSDYQQIIADIRNGRFVQIAISPDGEFYSTRESSFPDQDVCVLAVVADAVPAVRELEFGKITSIFITPPSYDEWMRRMNTREITSEQLNKRLAEARRSFNFVLTDDQTHFILNDDVSAATDQIKELLQDHVDPQREKLAKHTAQKIRDELSAKVSV